MQKTLGQFSVKKEATGWASETLDSLDYSTPPRTTHATPPHRADSQASIITAFPDVPTPGAS